MKLTARSILVVLVLAASVLTARAERIKDIVDVQGVRANPLWGYGLVIGLNGTGDNSAASTRAMANITPVIRLPVAEGITTRRMVRALVAPRAIDASR